MFLDSKLDFNEQIKWVFDELVNLLVLFLSSNFFLPRPSLLQICKSFVRPYPDCGDIIYDKAFIGSSQKKKKKKKKKCECIQ